MGLYSDLKGFCRMAAAFPKRPVLSTPKTHVPFQTVKRESIKPVLSSSTSQQVAGSPRREVEAKAPNRSYKTLLGTGQNNARWSHRENWFRVEDLAYDAEYMKTVIESQKYIVGYPHYDFHHYPNVYSYDPSRRWVGM